MSSLSEKIEALIRPSIEAMGFELVQLRLMDGNKSRLLQIMAERPEGGMTVEDCAAISNQVSAILDVEDAIPDAYRLEVSSPGIDRPLTREKDYNHYKGHLAKVETALPVDGRRRFTGKLDGLDEGRVVLVVDGEKIFLPYRDIQSAKLVLTDELIKAHQKKAS